MLFFTLVFCLVLAILSILKFRRIFNPFILEAYFPIAFIVIPQLLFLTLKISATTYFYSDLAILVYVLFLFLGSMVPVKGYSLKKIGNEKIIDYINILLFVSLTVPLIPMLLSFGVSIGGIRKFYEEVITTKYASFFEVSKWVLYFTIFLKLIQKQKFTIHFFIFFPFIFFYGSRFVILDFVIYLCVFLEQFKGLSFRKIAFLISIGAGMILIYSLFQGRNYKDGVYEMIASYFDLYKNQSFLIREILEGRIDYYNGEIYFSSFLKYIPRILWEDKPHAFGFAILNYRIFPNEAADGYFPSFGLGTTFADFGYIGLAVIGFVTCLIKRFFYNCFQKSRNNLTFFLYVCPFSPIIILFGGFYLGLDKVLNWLKSKNGLRDN